MRLQLVCTECAGFKFRPMDMDKFSMNKLLIFHIHLLFSMQWAVPDE